VDDAVAQQPRRGVEQLVERHRVPEVERAQALVELGVRRRRRHRQLA
jgi:hypothetical protein